MPLAKLVMRAAGDQARTACGNLQIRTGLEASIEGSTPSVGQSRLERVIERQRKAEAEDKRSKGSRVGVCWSGFIN